MSERIFTYIADRDAKVEEILRFNGFSTTLCNRIKLSPCQVLLNGKPVFLIHKANIGDVITVKLVENPPKIEPYHHDVHIVYEDDDIAVIDKSPDIAVLSTNQHYGISLINALANKWGNFVFHPVNRLDRQTSGLMLIAKHSLAHSLLSERLRHESAGGEKTVRRTYLALVGGNMQGKGRVDAPIGQPFEHTMIRGVCKDGKRAITDYESLKSSDKYSLVKLTLATGRTHQIRVHMSYMGHPLIGDSLYGGDASVIDRTALHSSELTFTHPISKEEMSFKVQPPEDMAELIERL